MNEKSYQKTINEISEFVMTIKEKKNHKGCLKHNSNLQLKMKI